MAAIESRRAAAASSLSFTELPWGCEYYLTHRPDDGRGRLRARWPTFDAIYLGAIGAPGVPDARRRPG